MIDPTLRQKVEQAAHLAAQRSKRVDLAGWMDRLKAAAKSPSLAERLELARSHRWAGAIPTWEPVDLSKKADVCPLDVIGVDGSQIYPREHGPVKWTYIQAVAYRKLVHPLFESSFFDIGTLLANGRQAGSEISEELMENRDELMALTNAWRTLMEMRLANHASRENPGTLTLFDNGLLPWLSVSGQSAQKQLKDYLENLLGIRPGLIAGVISGPQSHLLARLVSLIESETVEKGLREEQAILDMSLMRHHLGPGERSALFLHGSPRNQVFQDFGAGVFFFFLRINRNEIVRVEIPEWVVEDPPSIDLVHATILADSLPTGYSYVLSQAHQHVVVPMEIATMMHSVESSSFLAESGKVPYASGKTNFKRAKS